MPTEPYEIVGLDNLRKTLAQSLAQTAYLTLWDRATRDAEECIGRFDLDDDAVARHLAERRAADRGEDPPSPDAPNPIRANRRETVEAAVRWVREAVIANTGEEASHRFRVRYMSHKGQRVQTSVSLTCHNSAAVELVPTAPTVRLPTLSGDGGQGTITISEARTIVELFTHHAHLVIATTQQLHGVANQTIGQLQRQLSDSRDQVDQLVASILEGRAEAARADQSQVNQQRESDARTVLARDALKQLGEATRAVFAAKGVPPELAEVLGPVSQNPELLGALTDPDVRALITDPEHVKSLTAMLKEAAQRARAFREATANPNP